MSLSWRDLLLYSSKESSQTHDMVRFNNILSNVLFKTLDQVVLQVRKKEKKSLVFISFTSPLY